MVNASVVIGTVALIKSHITKIVNQAISLTRTFTIENSGVKSPISFFTETQIVGGVARFEAWTDDSGLMNKIRSCPPDKLGSQIICQDIRFGAGEIHHLKITFTNSDGISVERSISVSRNDKSIADVLTEWYENNANLIILGRNLVPVSNARLGFSTALIVTIEHKCRFS